MKILIIRHGHAVDEAPGIGDAGRWLSAKGRKVTRKVARWLDKKDKRRPTVIWTSPLVRAVQTAEIVAEGVDYDGEVTAIPELSPGRDPGDLIKRFDEHPVDGVLAVVGHEPSLTLIAHALLGDNRFAGFKKSGVMGVDWVDGKGTLRFILDPADMKAKKQIEATPPPAEPAASGDEG